MMPKTRFAWMIVVYLMCFALAVFAPTLHSQGRFGLSEVAIEELTIFFAGCIGLWMFVSYSKIVEEETDKQHKTISDHEKTKRELMESYAYIGTVNRKLELLKKVSNQTSLNFAKGRGWTKDLLQSLVTHAESSIGAQTCLLRVVDVSNLRTVSEHQHTTGTQFIFKVSNRDLQAVPERGASHAFIAGDDGKEILVVPSEGPGPMKAFLLFILDETRIPEVDASLLRVFANQAELIHRFTQQ